MTGALDRQDVLNQVSNHKRTYLFQISLWKQLDDKTIWSYPVFPIRKVFLIRKNIVRVKLQQHIQALVTSRLGWWLNYLFWLLILHVTGDQCQLWLGQELENCFQMQQFVHGKCTSFTTLMELLNTVIHRLQLINSAQLRNKKFQSICWSRNATLFITYACACRRCWSW